MERAYRIHKDEHRPAEDDPNRCNYLGGLWRGTGPRQALEAFLSSTWSTPSAGRYLVVVEAGTYPGVYAFDVIEQPRLVIV